ncbi:MAG: XdhC/CoxI family protein [Elusimicrobiota bacterium]
MNNFEIIHRLNEDITNKKTVAVVTIISVSGSTPRDEGSKMLVYADGSICGTIGGGVLEKLAIDEALKCIKDRKNKKVSFNLTPKGIDALCMGKVEIMIEVYSWPFKVVILGGGHVAKSLAKLLDFVSIPYIVVDERKDFANRDNFPGALKIINELPHKSIKKDIIIDSNTYIVIVTRGHLLDKECLIEAIKTDARYIGMIGSRSKVKEIFKELNKKKIYPQKDKRVFSPIGINLGGKTPNEISISIIAEILSVMYNTEIKHMRSF